MTTLVDTSALYALIDGDDQNTLDAARVWGELIDEDLVAHGYVVAESLALVRARLGWAGVATLTDDLLPRLRVEMIERRVHDAALGEYRSIGGGTSFVDRVTIAFARASAITRCFAYDPDLEAAGLQLARPGASAPTRDPGKETV